MAKTNTKVKASKAHRFGAFTRRHTLGKARALGKLSAKAARGLKAVGSEVTIGFVEEGKLDK